MFLLFTELVVEGLEVLLDCCGWDNFGLDFDLGLLFMKIDEVNIIVGSITLGLRLRLVRIL